MARLPLGPAQREALRAARRGFAAEALFGRQLMAMRLATVPLPLPRLTTVVYLATWPDEAALARFRAGPLRRWDAGPERLRLTLRPVQSFGSWDGADPLQGQRGEP